MIEAEHLSKRYGSLQAVDDLTFTVERGSVVGFLGPNGAGKSTTLRILAGFLGATTGQVRIAGHDIVTDSLRARKCIGYMPETSPLYPELRVREHLGFRAELKQIPRRRRAAEIASALEQAGVADVRDKLIGHLSKGYRQRVGLADALLGSPPLLILDEPTAGLDPNQIRDVRKLIAELAEERTVLLSTHILSEVEATCTRAIVIHQGRLLAQGPIAEIRAGRTAAKLRLTVAGKKKAVTRLLEAHPAVAAACGEPVLGEQRIYRFTVQLDPAGVELDEAGRPQLGPVTEQLVSSLVAAGIGVREVRPEAASLEQVFAELTGRAAVATASGEAGAPDHAAPEEEP